MGGLEGECPPRIFPALLGDKVAQQCWKRSFRERLRLSRALTTSIKLKESQ
jgi:hypothetical protein